jgi:6-phosphogluconate dehydrogenase (decarboxylating)
MNNKQPQQRYEIGMMKLIFLGRILVLNMVDNDIASGDYDKQQIKALPIEPTERNSRDAKNFIDFLIMLLKPSAVILLVPNRTTVNSVINDLLGNFQLDDFSRAEVQLCQR